MTIEGLNGKTYDVTGSGQGIYNTVGASAGIASLLGLNASNLLGGLGNRTCGNGVSCSDNEYVTRYNASMMQQLMDKDMQIATLKSDSTTDTKIIELYKAEQAARVADRERMDAIEKDILLKVDAEREARIQSVFQEREARLISEKEQAVFNQSAVGNFATVNAQIASMNNILQSISTNVVPQNKVCQTGCCCGMN